MPIEVKHNVPAAVLGGLAVAGGLADRERWQTDVALNVEQMKQRERMQARSIAADRISQALQMQQRQQEFVASIMERRAMAQQDAQARQQQLAMQQQADQMASDRDFRNRAGLIDHELSSTQRMEMAKLDRAKMEIMQSPHLDDNQKRVLMQQAVAKQAGVNEIPPSLPKMTMEEDFNQSVLHRPDPTTGTVTPWVKSKEGEWQVARGWSAPTPAASSQQSLYKEHYKPVYDEIVAERQAEFDRAQWAATLTNEWADDQYKKQLTTNPNAQKPRKIVPSPPKPPSQEEVNNRIADRDYQARLWQWDRGGRQGPPPQRVGPPTLGGPPQQPPQPPPQPPPVGMPDQVGYGTVQQPPEQWQPQQPPIGRVAPDQPPVDVPPPAPVAPDIPVDPSQEAAFRSDPESAWQAQLAAAKARHGGSMPSVVDPAVASDPAPFTQNQLMNPVTDEDGRFDPAYASNDPVVKQAQRRVAIERFGTPFIQGDPNIPIGAPYLDNQGNLRKKTTQHEGSDRDEATAKMLSRRKASTPLAPF